MAPKFTRSEAREIAAAIKEAERRGSGEPVDAEIMAAITGPVKLTAAEKRFLGKKENALPSIADMKAKFGGEEEEKVILPDFQAADATGRGSRHGDRGLRIAANRGTTLVPLEERKARCLAAIRSGMERLGLKEAPYYSRICDRLKLLAPSLDQLDLDDLYRVESLVKRDLGKARLS